jgi:enamine deaminase RidA (YjgF/YER057c/UK114 family)
MSQVVVHGGTIYLSGQVADDTSTDLVGQMRQVLAKLEALLARAGAAKTNIIAANIWLATMADFEEMNKAWEAWIPAGAAPARATVEAKLVTPAHRVEIAVIAANY